MKITILGAGVFGVALGNILKNNHHEINYFDPIKFKDQKLKNLLTDTKVIIYCAPSSQAKHLLPHLPTDPPLICASKGFLSLKPFTKFKHFSVMSGGTLASSLTKKLPTTFTITSPLISKLFARPFLDFQLTSDTLGVMLCGAFKNIYAIGAGANNLIEQPNNITEFLGTAKEELIQILEANHCDQNLIALACGWDDLRTTCLSPESRNYQFGKRLALNTTKTPFSKTSNFINATNPTTPNLITNTTIEGLSAVRSLKTTIDFIKPKSTPLLDQIIKLVEESKL